MSITDDTILAWLHENGRISLAEWGMTTAYGWRALYSKRPELKAVVKEFPYGSTPASTDEAGDDDLPF